MTRHSINDTTIGMVISTLLAIRGKERGHVSIINYRHPENLPYSFCVCRMGHGHLPIKAEAGSSASRVGLAPPSSSHKPTKPRMNAARPSAGADTDCPHTKPARHEEQRLWDRFPLCGFVAPCEIRFLSWLGSCGPEVIIWKRSPVLAIWQIGGASPTLRVASFEDALEKCTGHL
jgi:hypothetical protein